MFRSKVKSDTKKLSGLITRMKNLGSATVEAGYYENQMHPTHHMPLSTIALINERGYFGIPARDFMWQSFWNWKTKYNTAYTKDFAQRFVYHHADKKALLREVADSLKQEIKWTIQWEGVFERNAPMTIKYKGRDYPLYETGYLSTHAKSKINIS
jgi:hypothetical protein